jgi:uncharacterized protein (TIGR04255 family)
MPGPKYLKPPIEEAVCDIQFAPGTDWDPTMPGRLFEKLRHVYGEKPRMQQVVEAQVRGSNSQGNPSLSLKQTITKQRVQLLAEKGTRIVGVGAEQLTVHMLRPYTQWADFQPRILQALKAYQEIAAPEGVTRIGLRYINRITIEQENPELEKYFTIPPRFPKTDRPSKIMAFFNRKESQYLDKPIRIVVTFADMESASPGSSSYLFDIDIILMKDDEPFPLEEIEAPLEDIKTRHREVFESLITDDCRALFDAD